MLPSIFEVTVQLLVFYDSFYSQTINYAVLLYKLQVNFCVFCLLDLCIAYHDCGAVLVHSHILHVVFDFENRIKGCP